MRAPGNTVPHGIIVAEATALQGTVAAVIIMGARATLTLAGIPIMEGHILTGLERRMDLTRTRTMAVDTIHTPTMAVGTIHIRTTAVTHPGTLGTRITSQHTATAQRQSRQCNNAWVSLVTTTAQSTE